MADILSGVNVLLINSDLSSNRGDRAIAEGIIQMIREAHPEAGITALSERAGRDAGWFGVRMLPQGVHSLSPLAFIALLREARRSDVVLWGGGELLKDYTNRLGLWYWALKMTAVSWFAPRLVGAFQGIGPTTARSSQRLIARVVRRTDRFVVRDAESREKLVSWGVPPAKVVASFDSAVVPVVDRSPEVAAEVRQAAGLEDAFLRDFVAVAPRNWFHYRKGGLLPYRWRRTPAPSPENEAYRRQLVALVDDLLTRHANVLLVPMHMGEDPGFCQDIAARVSTAGAVRVLADDTVSPRALRAILGAARLMVAFRLHSGIVATTAGTMTVTYYYVDKGRLYCDQAGLSDFARPIEDFLSPQALEDFRAMERRALADKSLAQALSRRVATMAAQARADLREALAP